MNIELDTISLPGVSVITNKRRKLRADFDISKVERPPKERDLDYILSGLLSDLVGKPVEKNRLNQS